MGACEAKQADINPSKPQQPQQPQQPHRTLYENGKPVERFEGLPPMARISSGFRASGVVYSVTPTNDNVQGSKGPCI
eukprot:1343415-Amorphochlora_amoeboformis.AAC.1